jgi:hypothetical protein
MTIEEKIAKANSIRAMNLLREEVVQKMKTNPSVLKLWQDKYWALKRCPTCGREI